MPRWPDRLRSLISSGFFCFLFFFTFILATCCDVLRLWFETAKIPDECRAASSVCTLSYGAPGAAFLLISVLVHLPNVFSTQNM